jgi:tRNA nucleotidyltransferase (CCA-adding enzyme)
MNLIISHKGLDFDGLASMVAAQKLYPESVMVIDDKPHQNIQEFMSLHKDSLEIKQYKNLNGQNISRIIIVDTKNKKRIGRFIELINNPLVNILIYDHHPNSENDIKTDCIHSELVGATVTLLVEKIMEKKINISSFEATVFALGIYQDTGSLLFSTTTVRDVQAVAWLLGKGANLEVISNFIERPLSIEQQKLFNLLIKNSKTSIINGIRILITSGSVDRYIGGLDLLTQKLRDFYAQDVIFSVVKMNNRTFLVGRSNVESAPVNKILAEFGGSGHRKAASAVVKGTGIDEVLSKLHQLIKDKIKPGIIARDLMSSPVKTIKSDQSINAVSRTMLRYGHSGFPVTDGEKIIGMISRRDIEKAEFHGLGHAPVKGFMSSNVISISPETPLFEIQQLMIDKDIGRLPVNKEGKIIGIISRSDVLRVLHGTQVPKKYQLKPNYQNTIPNKIVSKMEYLLPPRVFSLIKQIRDYADNMEYRVFIVGGFVRDLLLGLPNLDLDLVVEGDGISFSKSLAEYLGVRIFFHERFGTANLYFNDGFKIDIATTRKEFYEYPAALPAVETGSLQHDLYRRDFTINAMAIGINKDNMGELFDFFSGQSDLKQGIIRVLYNLSFVEDPTRIIRAIRFEQRYGFRIEDQTMFFARQAINDKLIEKVSFYRIREELMLILGEENLYQILRRLDELGIWPFIIPEVNISAKLEYMLKKLPDATYFVKNFFPSIDRKLVILLILFYQLSADDVKAIDERFQWSKKYREEMIKVAERRNRIQEILDSLPVKNSILHHFFSDLSGEAVSYFMSISDQKNTMSIQDYLVSKDNAVVQINGDDLIRLGLKPGPIFKEIINSVIDGRLDGYIKSREDELNLVKQILKNERGD